MYRFISQCLRLALSEIIYSNYLKNESNQFLLAAADEIEAMSSNITLILSLRMSGLNAAVDIQYSFIHGRLIQLPTGTSSSPASPSAILNSFESFKSS